MGVNMKKRVWSKWICRVAGASLCVAVLFGTGLTAQAAGAGYTNAFTLKNSTNGSITIDGNFSDWDSLPCSYEYNWDNSQNCWQWGVWVRGVCYKTEPGTYSTDVRHKMQMYCDGENVYLHIVYSRDYGIDDGACINGSDFQFSVDGKRADFQLAQIGGGTFEEMAYFEPGLYPIEVRHRETGLSFLNANGADGYLYLTDDKINCEVEIRIPLSEMKRQNPSINVETITTIEFFTPNLMYRKISAVGTSSGPLVLSALCGGVVLCGWLGNKRKKDGYLQV